MNKFDPKLLFLNLALIFPLSSMAQFTGDLDQSFGQAGIVKYDHLQQETNDFYSDMTSDPSTDNIYSVGLTEVTGIGRALIYSVDANGAANAQFGTNGAAEFPDTVGNYSQFNAVEVDANGKIVVAGTVRTTSLDFLIARYNTDGTLDQSFNGNGYVAVNGNAQLDDNLFTLTILSSGKIMVGGYESLALDSTGTFVDSTQMWIACLNTDGTFDASFGNNGVLSIDFGTDKGDVYSIAEMPNGDVVIVGNAGTSAAVAMITANGSLQTAFSSDGKISISVGNYMYASDVKIMSTGQLLVSGDVFLSNGDVEGFVRVINPDGSPDGSFSNGSFQTDIDPLIPNYEFAIQEATELPNGKILCAGSVFYFGQGGLLEDIVLLMLNSDGSIDITFDGDGYRFYDIGNNSAESGNTLSFLSDGSLILGARTNDINSDYDMLLFKLTPLVNSVEAKDELQSLVAYPNPVVDQLTLAFELQEASTLNFTIVDLTGKILSQKQANLMQGTQQVQFNDELSNLSAGVYLLNYYNDTRSGSTYFVKE